MLVSVVLSAYNDERWLPESIKSVLAQTHQDLELILIDDGSTDNTPALLEHYAAQDSRVRVVTHENWGIARSRNQGTEMAAGEWVAIMDADDVMLPNRLERQLAFVAANSQVVVTSCMGYLIDEDGNRIGQTASELLTRADFERHLAQRLWFDIANSGVLMKKTAFADVGGYRAEVHYLEDADLWFRIAEAGGLILVQPERLMQYRKRRGSVSMRSFKQLREPLDYSGWLLVCADARRAGCPEPAYPVWLANEARRPWYARFSRTWRITAESWYRIAVINYTSGRALNAARYAVGAVALRPRRYGPMVVRKLDRRGVRKRAHLAVTRIRRRMPFSMPRQ